MGLVHVMSRLGGPLAIDNKGHTIAGGEHADTEETPLVRRLIDAELLDVVVDCPRHPDAPHEPQPDAETKAEVATTSSDTPADTAAAAGAATSRTTKTRERNR